MSAVYLPPECLVARAAIPLFLDKELALDRSASMWGHLLDCTGCFDELVGSARLKTKIQAVGRAPSAPGSLVSTIRAVVRSGT